MMEKIKFYDVKKRKNVEVNVKDCCCKVIYKKETKMGTQERYAVRAKGDDGTKLVRFIDKKTFDSLSCPIA